MFARRSVRRRIDNALAVASPLALAEAMDAYICSRSTHELRGLVERSAMRMDGSDRKQLDLYLNLEDPDDLIAHRFSAFLRQNPRAIAALDRDDVDSILAELGDLPQMRHNRRRLSPPALGFVSLVLAIAVLPLAAQYAHQRGLLQGLTDPLALPPPITPFVERVSARTPHVAPRPKPAAHHTPRRIAYHAPRTHKPRFIAKHVTRSKPALHRLPRAVAWKFDRTNNPYFNRIRWRHPYVADASIFGRRARLSVSSYLHALVVGDLGAALAHLGLPRDADARAIAELPIITRRTMIAIVGSKPDGNNEQVSADIVTDGSEYYEIFYVAPDGPATRIMDRYYIPVNRRAQVALRSLVQNSH